MKPGAKIAILSFFIALALSGCFADELVDTRNFVKEVNNRPGPPIEPLPEIKPYQAFAYASENKRSPFVPPSQPSVSDNLPSLSGGISPNFNRPRELLEGFPLDSLKMVGTVNIDNTMWAIIVDKEGLVHRVHEGNYIGQNHGKILRITETSLDLGEIVSDHRGDWEKRDVTLIVGE